MRNSVCSTFFVLILSMAYQLQAIAEPSVMVIDRDNPVKQFDEVVDAGQAIHELKAQPGEFRVFQIVISGADVGQRVDVQFKDVLGISGKKLEARQWTCLSLGGIGPDGKPFTNTIQTEAGRVTVLWVGVDLAPDLRETFDIDLPIVVGKNITHVKFQIKITGDNIVEHGDIVGSNLSRLRWLNSTLAQDKIVLAPFVSPAILWDAGHPIGALVLGRTLYLSEIGLPAQIDSLFNASNTKITTLSRQLLAKPTSFAVVRSDGSVSDWKVTQSAYETLSIQNGIASWTSHASTDGLSLVLDGTLEPEGIVNCKITLTATQDIDLSDIHLDIPYRTDTAIYAMGLGNKGGKRPDKIDWKWDANKQQDCLWMGDVNVGARWKFYDDTYRRPLVNVYFHFSNLVIPDSWGNAGKGGITLNNQHDDVQLSAYSGARVLKKGQMLHYNFELAITPFKPIDTEKQWAKRFIHPFEGSKQDGLEKALTDAHDNGANMVNIHHATPLNPHINYPYFDLSIDDLTDYVKRAHEKNMLVKVYYTTRELTTSLPELWALRTLGDPVIYPGPGNNAKTYIHKNGPAQWLKDNLREKYIPAWVHGGLPGKFKDETDLSVITTPDSRWNNFYIGGLDYLVHRAGIDGLYLDDTALDRHTLRRARAVLTDNRPEVFIDFHSWNHNAEVAGTSSSALIYMELMPYLDRLWLGEGFDANKVNLDYWLIEMSGIPFGMMSEMLQSGGNPPRGMVFGETNRLGWAGNPVPVWNAMDHFGMKGSEMIGWWDATNPVTSSNPSVPVTIYKQKNKVLISMASWDTNKAFVHLNIHYAQLGMNPSRCTAKTIAVEKFQEEKTYDLNQPIEVDPGKGLLIELVGE